ncbi:hypothetical protein DRF65_20775 [Chryseobacterium pennae]|uniref:Uncharacterized protein n=1 Tax=Chryseobacterium pennae TaxID=2258962 RepID=A0A3D9C3Q6_9FLAO|nr:hypothetical protein [Chryseobacterium pennae]REC60500.1 hypothetical protein DRF65_20775 [Chryseobacterium pennae]
MTNKQILEQYFKSISLSNLFWDFSYNGKNYTISDYILSNVLLNTSHKSWEFEILARSKVVECIYLIRSYDMIGSSFKTFEKLNFDKVEKINDVFICEKNNKTETWSSGRYYTVSEVPEGENYNKAFLPYFADVREDTNIPKELKRKGLKPKTYKNCQLMTKKNGGYYSFYSHTQKKELLIALNSHIYDPINK